jgi:D-alanyl-D-alanine carboxypeptidase/D-alanyl-D-alanine-endopeptidase (penicillin-binding protein 4)
VIARHRTDLPTILEVVNKRSQNFYAEALVKLLGLELCGEGSWAAGGEAVATFLDKVGIRRGAYVWADGSGMSRNNRFSARQLTSVLRHMYYHPHGRAYLRSLAYSGESELDPPWMTSSLSERLDEAGYRSNVLAKTGGLDGVSTLSGYVKAQSGRIYAFSILCNSAPARWRAIQAQDRIVRILVDRG